VNAAHSEHRKSARAAEGHEAQLPEPQLSLRSKDHARRLAEARKSRRGRRQRIFDRLVADDLPLDFAPLAGIGRRGLHDAVDEKTKAAIGRDPPGRGVRMGQQSPLLELLHDSADRRGRKADCSGKRFRSDRQAAFEIGFDHQAENLPHPVR